MGINDFALFNVIVSVVMLGSFLPGALGTITQRYFSFSIGQGDGAALKRVHDASLLLCAAATLLIALGLETLGTWFVAHHLAVGPERSFVAQALFQLTILSFIVSNFSGLYSSIVMAHEDMHVFALFSVIDAILRLGAVLCIELLAADGLIVYGLMLCGISAGLAAAYWIFCSRRYAECRPGRIRLETATLREMLGFAGWTVFGQITTVSRNQAVTVLINQAFNPATVAARALAVSVSAQALAFSTNFSAALHPPIIKAHAAGESERMFFLIFAGSKITFFLVWMGTLPMMAIMPGILALWLGDYPVETVLFTRLALIENVIVAISFPLMTAARATGQMRLYEISLGSLQLLVLVLSWLLVRAGYPAYSVYLAAIAVNLAMFAVRLAIVSNLTGLPAAVYLRRVLLPVLLVVGVSSGLVMAIMYLAPGAEALVLAPGSLGAAALICILPACVIYVLGLTGSERRTLHVAIRRRLAKFGGRP
ncbi:polysaccharide biosynthesis protein [Zavarzinia compransoris]|uniref:Polysaccharide biosynthesis protein n=1 Tax=Zavarzinia compransoris TaxID=1264899 RepID=A0A317E372_9PROT|nr:polysaccharide biosynthesis protein [Zavarzinia compransoris]